jgi:hypothetical protein
MNGFVRCRWFVTGGWRLTFQDIAGKLVVNILKLVDDLDVWQLDILVNVKELDVAGIHGCVCPATNAW